MKHELCEDVESIHRWNNGAVLEIVTDPSP